MASLLKWRPPLIYANEVEKNAPITCVPILNHLGCKEECMCQIICFYPNLQYQALFGLLTAPLLLLCGLMIHQTHLVTRGHRSVDGRANAQSLKYHIIYNKCTRMKTSFRACYKLWIIIIFIHIYPGTMSWVGFINLDEQTRVRHKTSTNSTFHQELTNITSAKDTVLIQYHWNAIKMTIKRYFLRTYEITPCGRRLVTRDPKSPNIF